ncbi:MAG TPA: permease [Isosphaeraceae bacterium]
MWESIFWGAVLRMAQAAISAAPTILVGLAVAGILRRLLGQAGTRRLFGCGTWRELPQAWAIGMLLPVCSLGVIPVAREMRRAGISPGTVLAFALTAPLFNPLSMLYGLTLSEPFVIIAFAFGSMVIVTFVGAALNRLFPGVAHEEPRPPPVAQGLRRMASIAVVAAREVSGPSLGYILIGLLGVGLLGAVLPPGSLQMTMEHTNPYAPLAMAGVAVPAYASPLTAMAQLGSMFQHANSPGAAFVLLTLGAGLNVGLIAWVVGTYGLRRGLAWLGLILAVVLAIAYAIENPLYPREITPPGHTHAFDMYCRPFHPGESHPAQAVAAKLREALQPFERVSLIVLGSLLGVGVVLRALDRRWRVETWLERTPGPADGAPGWFNLEVPGPVLGVVALLGLLAISVVGCYIFYPAPSEVFEEMSILKAEVLTAAMSGDRKHVERFTPVWDDWTRRLQVGVLLREGSLSPYRRTKAKLFRDRLEFLKHAVEEGDRDEARDYVNQVSRAYMRMRRAFLEPR